MGSPLSPNPYKTLGVPQDASLATIRSAHRKLVLTCHPDKFQDEAVKVEKSEQFYQVQQAYEILSDETKRQEYDEKVKLAELRAEVMKGKEKSGSRMGSGPEFGSRNVPEFNSRSRWSPVYEVRGDRVYEERVPIHHSHEEDVFSTKFSEHRRPGPKKYDDRYSPPAPRRTSGRMPEEKRRARDTEDERYEDKVYARQSAKAAEKSAKHGQEKRRDKDKKKDRETKFTSKSQYIGVDEDSDFDVTERVYAKPTSKRRHDDIRETQRRERDDPHRRLNRREDSDHSLDLDYKIRSVGDYIEHSRRAAPIEVETRRPAPVHKQNFSLDDYDRLPTPPSAAPRSPIDDVRRSSARPREGRRISPDRPSGRERNITEIVGPPSARRPSISRLSPELRASKNMGSSKKEPVRVSASAEARQQSLRRADTMPVGASSTRRSEPLPTKSKLKSSEINDSGYSSSGTPELYQPISPPLQRRTTTYQINTDDEEPRRVKQVFNEPEEIFRERERDRDRDRDRERDRGVSPKTRATTTDRPAIRLSANARGPPPRSNSYAFQTETSASRPPSFSRADTSRVPLVQARQSSRAGLFGEVPDILSRPYEVIRQSSRIRPEHISYSPRSPEQALRDTFPGSHFEPRSNRSRNEPKAY